MNFDLHLDRPLLFLAVLLPLVAWTVWVYLRTEPAPRSSHRRLLISLRLAASLLLALMLGAWSLEWTRKRSEAPRLQVLLDASASMSLPMENSSGSISRYQAALDLIDVLAEEPELELKVASFGEGLIEGDPPATAEAAFTDFGAALEALPAARPGEKLLLLSDGQDRGGGLWAHEASRPVLAMMLGDSMPQPDLRLARPRFPALLQLGERGTMQVEIQSVQGGARQGRIILREGEDLLHEQDWVMNEGPGLLEIDIPLHFEEEGTRRLSLELLGDGEDANSSNNLQVFSLDVLDERLEILVLAGRPGWDLPFLLDALRGQENLGLRLIVGGPGGSPRDAETGEPWQPGEEPVDGLLLHSLQPGWGDWISSLDPGGLFIGPGAMGAAVYPEEWGLDLRHSPAREGEFPLRWAAEAFRHEAMGALEAKAGASAPLPALEALGSLDAPGLRSLIESEGRRVLGARVWKGQRQVFLAGEGLYRMALADEAGQENLAALYSGLIHWLSRRNPPERIQILPPERLRRSGRSTELRAGLFDAEFRRLEEGELRWTLREKGEWVASGSFNAPEREGDDFRAQLPALPAADYSLELEAQLQSGESFERETEFPILPDVGEYARAEASPSALRWLAAVSQGEFFPGVQEDALREALPREAQEQIRKIRLRIWDHPLFFLLFLGLLAAEWGLRKRYGLV